VASTVGDGNVSVGAVRSIFTVAEAELDKPALLVTVHVSVVPSSGVSLLSVVVAHPLDEAIPDSGSETDQPTVTGPLFQPLLLAVGVSAGVITGAVASASRKLAVIVPAPCIVTVVDAEESVKTTDVVSLDHDE
jgi:hypothetical protein